MFLKELNNLEDKAQFIIGYFERKDDVEYENFRKVASNVKEIVAYTSSCRMIWGSKYFERLIVQTYLYFCFVMYYI